MHSDCNIPKFGLLQSAYEMKFFIILFERAFKMIFKIYFIVIAFLMAELFKILIYAN